MKKIIMFLILFFFPITVNAAQSEIVMDSNSGRIIHSENIHQKYLVASTSKIMTAIVAIENGNLKDKYVVGKEIEEVYGSSMYLSVGEKVTLKELLYGLILRSGNDAAVVISNNVVKNEKKFIYLMNKKAKELNLKNTTFNNSHGLDNKNENISSAYDLAIIMKYAMENKDFKKIMKSKRKIFLTDKNQYKLYNKNILLNRYKYCTGGKTGYTPKAGKSLITTASRDNTNLIIVTLKDPNRFSTHQMLYEKYFKLYKTYKVINKETYKIKDKKHYKNYKIYVKNDIDIALTNIEKENVKVIIKLKKKRNKNNKIGNLYIYVNNKFIIKESVYAKRKIFKFLK